MTAAVHTRFASRLRQLMVLRGLTQTAIAGRLGVSQTSVGYWASGRYIPGLSLIDRLCDLLDDALLRSLAVAAKTGRCPCGATFDRKQSKKLYCSAEHQRAAHLKGGRKANPRQDAIAAFCGECEPEGLCRDDRCALRAFSPLLFVAMRRSA